MIQAVKTAGLIDDVDRSRIRTYDRIWRMGIQVSEESIFVNVEKGNIRVRVSPDLGLRMWQDNAGVFKGIGAVRIWEAER